MRAFLSHSSTDKDFVNGVADGLRPGTYELDSETFDTGLLNSVTIKDALGRSDLFCLFLSQASVRSSYVEFETLLGLEFLARGNISGFLAICLDNEAFSRASDNVKLFNVVRKILSVASAVRLIQGQLITASAKQKDFEHPFIGRDEELRLLDEQVSDHRRPNIKSIYLSGNSGTGRRTLAARFYGNHFPHVGRIFPTIHVAQYDGPLELYRHVLSELRPTITANQLRASMVGFDRSNTEERQRLTAQLLNSLLPSSEAALFVDEGGVLTDSGSFTPEIVGLLNGLEAHPHPPVVFISQRMIPGRYRSSIADVAFLAIKALDWDSAMRLMAALLKRRKVEIDTECLEGLTKLSEGHPFNIYQIELEVREQGVRAFLANPAEFNEWKHRQTSEYVSKVSLSQNGRLALALLKILPELDFDTMVEALKIDGSVLANELQQLVLLHVVDAEGDRFRISPALRVAVERDTRIKMPSSMLATATSSVARSLNLRIEEGTAPVSLVDAAVLASVETSGVLTELAAAFLLPSHYVWLTKIRYDQHQWLECIRFGLEALSGESRLSTNGLVATCRFLCLAAARTGNDSVFEKSVGKLQSRATDNWARSNVSYLKGFQLRMRGRLPAAQEFFEKAIEFHDGNNSAMRELASIALARGDLDMAEGLARKAHSYARTNPFIVDILLAVLIRKGGSPVRDSEIDDLFATLEKVGEENGRSFYLSRRAEYDYLWGDIKKAARLIDEAVIKTPTIFEVRRLQAEICLKAGNKSKADEALQAMSRMMEDRDVYERRSNYRLFLETKAHYLVEVGQFSAARTLYNDVAYFTLEEREKAIKDIEMSEAYSNTKTSGP